MHAGILGGGQHEELLNCILFLGLHPAGEAPDQRFAQAVALRDLLGFSAGANQRLDLRNRQTGSRRGLLIPLFFGLELLGFEDGVFQRVVHSDAEEHAAQGEHELPVASDMVELGFLYRIFRHVRTTFLVFGNTSYTTPENTGFVSYFTMFWKRVSYAGYRSCILWRVTHNS